MTKERMIELLKIEHECMRRGAHNECDRDCAKCELVQDDRELDEMYTGVVVLLDEKEAKPPVHIYEEYPEHDWKRKENGDIDDFAWDGDYHNGPMCKRCYYSFCVLCNPNGWDKKRCIIDEYKCPKCGMDISEGTKFCPDCGQAVKWK